MKLLRPCTLIEALDMLAEGGSSIRPIAGGTDLLVSWHHHDKRDWTLLDLSPLRDHLQPMRLTDEALELGGLTTYWDVMRSAEVSRAFPLLADAARQVGAVQIQTRGTWAGNVANGSPAADGVPVLLAYDAVIVLRSVTGQRQVPLDRYWTGYKQSVRRPDELIVSIRLPRRERDVEWFHKVGARAAQAITKVGVAVVHDDEGWRIAANSVAPFVCRCRALEAALDKGERPADARRMHDLLIVDVAPIDDLRSTAAYRSAVLSRLLWWGLAGTGSDGGGERA